MKNIILKIKLRLLKYLINSIWKYNSNMCKEKFTESTLDDLYTLINFKDIRITTRLMKNKNNTK
jgi:hypothetical protein